MESKIEVIPVSVVEGYFVKFRAELLQEIKSLIQGDSRKIENKWIKSTEVKKILNVSHGKLQTMRNSGQIPFTKIGGSLFYDRDDIMKMFDDLKINRKKSMVSIASQYLKNAA